MTSENVRAFGIGMCLGTITVSICLGYGVMFQFAVLLSLVFPLLWSWKWKVS